MWRPRLPVKVMMRAARSTSSALSLNSEHLRIPVWRESTAAAFTSPERSGKSFTSSSADSTRSRLLTVEPRAHLILRHGLSPSMSFSMAKSKTWESVLIYAFAVAGVTPRPY